MTVVPFPRFHLPSWALWVVITAGLAAGCSRYHEDEWSRKWPPRHPAQGFVELDGSPLEGATVTFFTERADRGNEPFSAVGITDSAGRFVLKTFRPNDGAVAGTHIVMIEKSSFDDKTGRVVTALPRRYARQETSGLTAEVTEKGANDFTFQLESK
jgi:serine/threonine-protein phosphatase CPPED1